MAHALGALPEEIRQQLVLPTRDPADRVRADQRTYPGIRGPRSRAPELIELIFGDYARELKLGIAAAMRSLLPG
ncbi:MAG: hypothetical protein U5O39_00665 [Gammaproteobacteria bacterium]|nr:hypothetical protein [Gammaproteobacteria bacterium]